VILSRQTATDQAAVGCTTWPPPLPVRRVLRAMRRWYSRLPPHQRPAPQWLSTAIPPEQAVELARLGWCSLPGVAVAYITEPVDARRARRQRRVRRLLRDLAHLVIRRPYLVAGLMAHAVQEGDR
jgi:hypothetical protein